MKVVELKIKIFERDKKYFTQIDNFKLEKFELPYPYFGNYQKTKEIDEKQLPFFGNLIFENIFCTDESLSYFENIFNNLRDDILVISIISNNSTILEIPFEILTFNENILLKNSNIHLIRRVNEEVKSFESSKSIFNILFIISLPLKIYDEAPIDPLKEFSKIYEGLSEFREFVNIDILENASEKAIKEALRKKEYDIIHFSGHGVENGLVIESNEDFNEERILKGKEIKSLFEGVKAKAIILDACFTSATSKEKKQNEYYSSSVSSQFENTPIVLANQSFVYDDFATFEMENIYREIFKLKPFEILKSVRKLEHNDWWKPTLYFEVNLNDKLFELNESKQEKKIIKTLNRFNRNDIYIYRYRPVREALEALRQNRIVLFHGIGGSGKSHLADYIIEMLKGEFNYIIAVDVSRYKSIKEIKSYIRDFLFKEEIFLIIDNLETLLDRDGVVVDDEVGEFLKEIISEKFRGRVLFTSRIIPSLKDESKIVESIVEIEPYSEAEFHNLYFAYQEAENYEVCKYLKANFEKFREYDFYLLLISKAIENRVSNIDELLKDKEIREILEYYLNYFKESNSLLKIAILHYPISKEFFKVLLKEDEKLREINKIVKLANFKDETYKLYEVIKRFVSNESDKKLIENELFDNLKEFKAKEYFDFKNSIYLFEKFNYIDKKVSSYYNELGNLYTNRGELKKAELYYLKSLNTPNMTLRDICITNINLGELYRNSDEFNKAKEYSIKALEFAEDYEDNSTEWLRSMVVLYNTVALLYLEEYKFDRARESFVKALKIAKKNSIFKELSTTYNNIAIYYYEQSNFIKSQKYYEKALNLDEKYNKENHLLAITYGNLALFYQDLNLFDKANEYFLKALEIEKRVGVTIESKVISHLNIASFYKDIGEFEEAKKYLNSANKTLTFIKNNFLTSQVSNAYGMLLLDLKRYKISREYFNKALEYANKSSEPDYAQIAMIYENIASTYLKEENYQECEGNLIKALNLKIDKLGEYHQNTAQTYNNLGVYYLETKKFEKAKEYLIKSLNIRKELFGEENEAIASSYNNLALIFNNLNDCKMAKRYYSKTIKALENKLGKKHPKVAFCYHNYAHFLYELAVTTKERKYLLQAKEYFKKSYLSIESFSDYIQDFIRYYIFYIMTKADLKEKVSEEICFILKIIEYSNLSEFIVSNDEFGESLLLLYELLNESTPKSGECVKRWSLMRETIEEVNLRN